MLYSPRIAIVDGKPKRKAGKLDKRQSKGFHKMNESSKGKFMKAVFGKDGKHEADIARYPN